MRLENALGIPLRDALRLVQRKIREDTRYRGVRTKKCPTDLWVYQEIIHETRPTLVLEFGTLFGGSALALADIVERTTGGRVISVDFNHSNVVPQVRDDPRITLVTGPALEAGTAEAVRRAVWVDDQVMIIEDSSHTYKNTLGILQEYSDLVAPGGYFVVEDTICWHGVASGPRPGPYEAVRDFVREDQRFEVDRDREGFLITWNPTGYLRRIR